jgi:GT2 family glycosyltransferase
MTCLSRRVFETVRGFDERYHWGYEDVDLCLKVRRAGFRVLYVPEAESVHEESVTLSGLRNPAALAHNYRRYRANWDAELAGREKEYIQGVKREAVRRVVMLGTGQAARGLSRILWDNGIETVAFTSSRVETRKRFCGRPVVDLESLRGMSFDRLVIASQYFFEFENSVRDYDPVGAPIFPALNSHADH